MILIILIFNDFSNATMNYICSIKTQFKKTLELPPKTKNPFQEGQL